MSTHYSLLFYLKKPKNYVSGPKTIYMRITVDGIPKEISTGRECDQSRWNSKANRINGTKEESKTLNAYLDTLEHKMADCHHALVKDGSEISSEILKFKFLGKDSEKHYLITEFLDHNKKMEALIGKGYKPNTLKGYKTTTGHLAMYLKEKLGLTDIDIKKINLAFILGFEFYLRSDMSCSEITTAKYIKHFRKIINLCRAHKWITDNPLVFYKNKAKPTEKEFLTQDELERIEQKEFKINRIDHVRDIFIFCCYTGLAYIDVKQLQVSDIAKGVDGKLWVLTNREKTETNSNIPLLPQALNIINKYVDYPPSASKGLALPVLSNQKMNSYLKEIADLCQINKEITFHKARHTFATTVTLSNNVPIETVSKMLGHTNIKTTQHYAKLLDTRVGSDMQTLQQKLKLQQDQTNDDTDKN
ncbi:site-specific integrase [Pedobacter sp. ISL-68]|uniref:site-specific integrase n=1 Tax=unclassified Pedobacter TaxID=2628915 RepID=UPI001BE9D776|nr:MULTISPECIES: site-specific integrase [unclassified Pedobacter]MBT2559870.1 site-specific integrase [Pedobacter sp. ISL-64]MBT2592175.1 site-specific integrase [Pedobacter sp. ISL-68]